MTNSINNTNTGNPEWGTPDHIIERARNTMGSIDCDPATFPAAQKHINAGTHYTKETNGIDKNWIGNIWLNPPYFTGSKNNPGINAFVKKLLEEIKSGNVKQAIFLAQAKIDTKWFQSLAAVADAVIFTRGRVKFVDAFGVEGGSPGYGSVFFYFGDNKTGFIKNFDGIAYQL